MKRGERIKWKTEPNQAQSAPQHHSADDHKRDISGSINIRGEIETKRPPDLAQEHATERTEDHAQDKKRFVVELITLIFVILVACLTALQDYFTWKYVGISQATFNSSQRPYVGINGIAVSFNGIDKNGHFFKSPGPTPQTVNMAITVQIKNFGPVPGTNLTANWKLLVNGVVIPTSGVPDRKPDTLLLPR